MACLEIKAPGKHFPAISSWRTRVRLPPGHYRFEASVQIEDFNPLPNAPGGGVCLRVYAGPSSRATVVSNKPGWQPLTCDFNVTSPDQDQELICEARCFHGTMRFASDRIFLRCLRVER